jgi:mannose-6-phosphate isomerase-like protein (cupin superfamily)
MVILPVHLARPSVRHVLLVAVCFSLSASGAAQDNVHFSAADRVTVRDMSAVPSVDIAPGVRFRTVVGSTASFSLAEFDAGSATATHHHTREQVDVGLTGTFDMTIGSRVEALAPGAGVIVPANVSHAIANKQGGVMTLVEFHTVRRPDLVPPRPAMTYPASPKPVEPGPGPFVAQLDVSDRARGGDGTLRAQTSRLAWQRLAQNGAPIEFPAAKVERFVYIVRGMAEAMAQRNAQRVGPGTLIVIPAGHERMTIRAIDADVALVEFSLIG